MKYVFLAIALTLSMPCLGAEPKAKPTKEEMRKKLDDYVKENQEASATIAPLIEKLRTILNKQPEMDHKDGK